MKKFCQTARLTSTNALNDSTVKNGERCIYGILDMPVNMVMLKLIGMNYCPSLNVVFESMHHTKPYPTSKTCTIGWFIVRLVSSNKASLLRKWRKKSHSRQWCKINCILVHTFQRATVIKKRSSLTSLTSDIQRKPCKEVKHS